MTNITYYKHRRDRINDGIRQEDAKGRDKDEFKIKRMEKAPPEVKAEIFGMLGRHGDKSVLPVFLQELQSEEPVVCAAAIEASVRLGGDTVLPELWPLLQTDSEDKIEALRDALLGFPASLVVPEAARILGDVPPQAAGGRIPDRGS